MKLRIHSIRILALIMVAIGSTQAQAAIMAYEFTGVIDQIDALGSGWVLDDSIKPGTSFWGRFTFDTEAVDTIPGSTSGQYTGSSFSMYVEIGSYSWFSGNGVGTITVHNSILDVLVFGSRGFETDEGFGVNALACSLTDPTATFLSADSIPTVPFPLSGPNSFFGKIYDIPWTGESLFWGHLTTLVVVPEPASVLLLLLTLAFLPKRSK